MSFYEKYIKYKTKYLELNKKLKKNQSGVLKFVQCAQVTIV